MIPKCFFCWVRWGMYAVWMCARPYDKENGECDTLGLDKAVDVLTEKEREKWWF